jgi:hypothetical protein
MPLQYWVADDGTTETDCEEALPAGYCREGSAFGYSQWENAPCSEISAEYMGVSENIGFNRSNELNYMSYNDPESDLPEPGTLAATLNTSSGVAFFLDGKMYKHLTDSDIVYNENAQFETLENIESGNCNGQHSFMGTTTHEIGHLLGMGHSCEEGDTCNDPALREAVMHWTGPACNPEDHVLKDDDIQGITALYGPYASFTCSHQITDDFVIGVVPFTMKCTVQSESRQEVTTADWNFGDGGTDSGADVSHTYTEAGNYNVQVTVRGDRDTCGDEGWTFDFRKVGFVTACDVPSVSFGVEHVDGMTYRMLNESDISTYGCIQDIAWEVFEGSGTGGKQILDTSIRAWEPLIEFPNTGTYTVIANVGGPAGTGAATLTFEVENKRGNGYGCSTVGTTGGVAGVLIGLGMAMRRRKV